MRRKRRRFHPALWLLAAAAAILAGGYAAAEENLRPAATAMAEHRIRLTAETAVNDGVEEVLAGLADASLVEVIRNGEGEVQAVEVRMQTVNQVKLRITEQILRNLRRAGDAEGLKIPLGSLLGSGLLAGKGPGLTYRFLSEGSVSTRILSRFEACGVNQTRHQLLLSVEVRGCAILSRYQVEVEVPTEYVLAETVVVGAVPESYTQVFTGDTELVREINDYQAEIRP